MAERSSRTVRTIGLILVLLALAGIYIFSGRQEKLANMSAVEAHLSLGAGSAEPITSVDRAQIPQIYYHVVLRGVPLGWGLELSCDWLDPAGAIARHSVYETRFIHKSTWPTHCRQEFSSAAAAGQWEVRLMSGTRVLSTSSFILK